MLSDINDTDFLFTSIDSMYRKSLILLLFASLQSFAQNDTLSRLQVLETVTISALHLNDSLLNAPASIGIVPEKILQANNHTDISTAVNRISGVYMQTANMTTNRITIRGVGARTPYGTNKIRAFYGNIPLTSGNSETTIDDIDLENIRQIEIIKGPLSSLYGAGLGGAILIEPKIYDKNGQTASISTTHGSFGLLKNSVNLGLNNSGSSLNINYHNLETDGWRENSAYRREGVTIAGNLFRKENSNFTYFFNHTNLKAFIPSSIDKETFENNPQAAAPTWKASKGFKDYKSVLAGLSYEFQVSENFKNATSIFTSYKDNNEPRPFDVLRQYTLGYGARSQFSGQFQVRKMVSVFHFGFEYFGDKYSGKTLENLYSQNNGLGSLEGDQLSGTAQQRQFYNAFAQLRLQFSRQWELQTGLNVNQTTFQLDTNFPVADSNSESYSYDAIWSPQVSLLFKPASLQTIYLSASRGFSLPSVEETLTANGNINSAIKPEKGYHFELGWKTYSLSRKLYGEIAAYSMHINDLLVAQRVGDDQYVGVNAGKTLHQGVEMAANYRWDISRQLSLSPFVAASIGRYEFDEFIDDANDFSGKKLTGVPASKINAGLTIERNSGLYLSVDYQFVDEIPLNDGNSVYSDSYQIVNLKTGYRFEIFRNFHSQLAAGINNMTDENHASMVLVNATGFGGSAPRYYYPGLPLNYYVSCQFNYTF